MPTEKPIKIGEIYQHPRTRAIIVPYEFDTGERGTRNFHLSNLEGLSEQEIKDYIMRVIRQHYNECKRLKERAPEEKAKVSKAIADLSGLETE